MHARCVEMEPVVEEGATEGEVEAVASIWASAMRRLASGAEERLT